MSTNFKAFPPINNIKEVPFFEPEAIPYCGSKAYLWNDNDTEIVYMHIVFNAGNIRDNNTIVSNAVHNLVMLGTAKLSSADISLEIENFGGKVHCKPNIAQTILFISAPKTHFLKVLNIGLGAFVGALYTPTELELYKTKKKQSLAIQMQKTSSIAGRSMRSLSYGKSHVYGVETIAEMYDTIQSNNLQREKEKYFNINNCVFALSGCFDDKILKLAEKELEVLPQGNPFEPQFIVDPHPGCGFEKFIQKDGALQASVKMKKWTTPPYQSRFAELLLLNVVFGGYFGSRLMQNIREDKGWTYGIHSSVNIYNKNFSSFTISCEVENSKRNQTVDEIIKEMNLLKTQPMDEKELTKAKNYYLGSILKSYNLKINSIGLLGSFIQFNRPFNYHKELTRSVLNCTPDKILQLSNTIFTPNTFYKVVVGNKNY